MLQKPFRRSYKGSVKLLVCCRRGALSVPPVCSGCSWYVCSLSSIFSKQSWDLFLGRGGACRIASSIGAQWHHGQCSHDPIVHTWLCLYAHTCCAESNNSQMHAGFRLFLNTTTQLYHYQRFHHYQQRSLGVFKSRDISVVDMNLCFLDILFSLI